MDRKVAVKELPIIELVGFDGKVIKLDCLESFAIYQSIGEKTCVRFSSSVFEMDEDGDEIGLPMAIQKLIVEYDGIKQYDFSTVKIYKVFRNGKMKRYREVYKQGVRVQEFEYEF